MWTAIMALSVLGLFAPERFSPVLVMQVIYKILWLLCYALPRLARGRRGEVPWGIGGTFIVIVLTYPFVIPWRYLFSL